MSALPIPGLQETPPNFYTVNAFRRRSISLIFDGGEDEVNLPNDDEDTPVLRLGGGVNFTRPLPKYSGEIRMDGFSWLTVSTIRDGDGDPSPEDELGNELSFSGEGKDDLLTLQLERCAIAVMTLCEPLAVPSSGLGLSSPYQWEREIFSNRL